MPINILYIVNNSESNTATDLNEFISKFNIDNELFNRHFVFVTPPSKLVNDISNINFNIETGSVNFFNDILNLNSKYSYTSPDVVGIISNIKSANVEISNETLHLNNFKYTNVGISMNKDDITYDYGWKVPDSNIFFGDGWHNLELGDKYFIWSSYKGTIYAKGTILKMEISNHNKNLKNIYIFNDNNLYKYFPVNTGDNLIEFTLPSNTEYSKLDIVCDTFNPSKENLKSTDNRDLGIAVIKADIDGVTYLVNNIGRKENYILSISKKTELLEDLNLKIDRYYYSKVSKSGNFYVRPTLISTLPESTTPLLFDGTVLLFYLATYSKLIIKNV